MAALLALLLGLAPGLSQPAAAGKDLIGNPALDKLLQLLFQGLPPPDELARLKDTLQTIYNKDWAHTEQAIGGLSEPLTKKIARWYLFKVPGSPASAANLARFAAENPLWPVADFEALAEDHLFQDGAGDQSVLDFFGKAEPTTGSGRIRLGQALVAKGDGKRAISLVREAWRENSLTASEEALVLKEFGSKLSVADHLWRIDTLLLADRRWGVDRAARAAGAKRLRGFLPAAAQKVLDARLSVFACGSGRSSCLGRAAKVLPALAAAPSTDWGALFQRAQLLRLLNRPEDAGKLLVLAPASSDKVANPDGWAAERRLTALDLVEQGKFKTAYSIVSSHGDLSQKPLWDAEFFSGFLALRFLKEPKTALTHFIASRKAAALSSEKSQSAYWIARAEDVLGHTDKAAAAYKDAAGDNTVFYGQLAQQFLKPKSQNLALGAPHVPSAAEARAFTSLDAMRAGVIVERAGLPDVARLFFAHLRETLKDDAQFTLLAHYAYKSGDTPMTLRAGRKGMQYGHDLAIYAYPTYAMPSFKPLRSLPEYPIFYAIARQESEFSANAVSGAGARGVLQLMPATARGVCSQYKVKCDIKKLTLDPGYNVSLATAYIADRHDDFSGSYILALAGYNAGPGRAREWIKALGDPRSPKVDPIDWIEQIPLPETRDYVKKVLANIQVYRALLGDPATALRVREDLVRARFPS